MLETKDIATQQLYRRANMLAWLTVVYNIIEGLVSVFFGLQDETLALFGFGLDSFIETISASGIVMMIHRLQRGKSTRTEGEILALKITGWCFYALTIVLLAMAAVNIYMGHVPETTVIGIIIGGLSILTMWLLIHLKLKTGRMLNSDAIVADANCNKVCMYMSIVLLGASLLFELTGIGWFDSLGALGLAWFSYNEGKEAFEKAEGHACSCED